MDPGKPDLETVEFPHQPFEEVSLCLNEPDDPDHAQVDESMIVPGLENFALRKTSAGAELRAFLEANLADENPVDKIIWELYEETMKYGKEESQS